MSDYRPPDGCVPRRYQVRGAAMIAVMGKVLILDEPGTGKTITSIVGLMERGTFPVLVVAPASVVDPWVRAWWQWAPGVRAVAWRGPTRHEMGPADVYVTSYDTARKGVPAGIEALVIDECHLIKNPHTARSKAVRKVAKGLGTVVALSGTPITHHPGDLWPTLQALEPDAWPSRQRWVDRFCVSVPGAYEDVIVGLRREREPELRTCLLGQYRRVAKLDVLDQLPPKVYSVRTVHLPPAYRRAYRDMESMMYAELPDGGELSVMETLSQLTRLSQLASAAADVETHTETTPDGEVRPHVNVSLREPSWKADALLDVLAERPGSPVVAFAPSRQLVTLAGRMAERAGYSVGYVVGGQSMGARTATIERFQAGGFDLLCATTGAGGVGVTFTAAKTAVFLQRPWSLVEALQAEDRLHRIGAESHDCIEIIDIVAERTIDARVRKVLRGKAGQLADVVQDPRIVAELLGGSKSTPAAA